MQNIWYTKFNCNKQKIPHFRVLEGVIVAIAISLIKKIAQLFISIFLGWFVVKIKLLKSEDSKVISKIALFITVPCLMITTFQIDYTPEIRDGLLLAILAALVVNVTYAIFVNVFGKPFKLDTLEKSSIMFSNAGNLTMPVILSVLGPDWTIYGVGYMLVQDVFLWSYGRMLMSNEKKIDFKKMFLNVNMIALFIGGLLFLLRIKLPEILQGPVESFSAMVGPLSMFIAGMLIAGCTFKQVVSNKRIYLVITMRMIVCPLIAMCILKFSGMANLVPDGKMILLVSLIASVAPTASTITNMAQIYGRDSVYASSINVVTTLMCIITMPLMVFLYQL